MFDLLYVLMLLFVISVFVKMGSFFESFVRNSSVSIEIEYVKI